jgi:hypothetical protein
MMVITRETQIVCYQRCFGAHWLCLCVFSVGNALFEAFSESVYSEVAALISSNENRPHFLVQLFRDLQMISSDPLRQRTLQSIQEIISQYLANTVVGSHHQPLTDSQQLGEVSDNCHLLPVSILLVLKRCQKMGGNSIQLYKSLWMRFSIFLWLQHCSQHI